MRSTDAEKQERPEKSCLQLWIAPLDHSSLGDEHESALLSGVAMLDLKEEHHRGGWAPAHEFSRTSEAQSIFLKLCVGKTNNLLETVQSYLKIKLLEISYSMY